MAMSKTTVVFRPRAMDHLLNDPYGPVGRYLFARGRAIMAGAKNQVGVKTGRLKASIHMRQERAPFGQVLRVGSPLSYALMHHEGTRPHIITPDRAKVLRFTSGGRVIYTHAVKHPGTRPNRYLTDHLHLIR
ncbi:MAG: hypothetical protein EBU08_18135 [Micrococcales bacterium]|nr:hypothetical protein [Micrococcales bacterium]